MSQAGNEPPGDEPGVGAPGADVPATGSPATGSPATASPAAASPAAASPAAGSPAAGVAVTHLDEGYLFRLLIASDAGFGTIVRAASKIQRYAQLDWPQLVLFEATDTFPFRPRPSTILVSGMPEGVIACVPELDQFGIASRLASTTGLPGCYDGPVVELAETWLKACEPALLAQLDIMVSGAPDMVQSVQELGARMNLKVTVLPPQSAP